MADPFGLQRFVDAQRDAYDAALAEVRGGRKRGHWMWFVFPQIDGLGSSPTARYYAIASLGEAQAYLAHPLLGARLVEIVDALQTLSATRADDVFGGIDAMKLRSSLTLFAAAGGPPVIGAALRRWFGQGDAATLDLLDRARGLASTGPRGVSRSSGTP